MALLLAACNPAAPPAAPSLAPDAATEQPDPDLGPFSVHLLANKTELEVAGDMNIGVTSAVRKLLDATPGVQVIHLNSPGGEAHEGYLLNRLIKERHLATYTATICASACTEAFLGGSPRYLARGAKLGFHSASHSVGGLSWNTVNDALRNFYRDAGLPDAFINRALQTAPSDIWIPTDDELRSAHVIDQMVDRSKFAMSGAGYWQNATEVDEVLKANALYSAMSSHDPAGYAQVRDIFLKGAEAGHSTADIQNEADKFVTNKLLPSYIAKAPDEQVRRYFAVQARELQYLGEKDPTTCIAAAFPELGLPAPTLAIILPASLVNDDLATLTDLVKNALSQPQATSDPSKTADALLRYYHQLDAPSRDALDFIQKPQAHREEPQKLCHAVAMLFQGIVDLPPQDAAIIERQFLSSRS